MLLNYTGKNGELNFEKDLVSELIKVGWEKEVIKEPTEDDLIENWRKIIYDNKGRVTEVIGSGENGTLTEQEYDMCKFTLKCRSDEETIKQISVKFSVTEKVIKRSKREIQ